MATDNEPQGGTNFHLLAFVERIEREETEKAEIAAGIKDIYAEVKSAGFTPKTVRQLVKIRMADASARAKMAEESEELELYMAEVGMEL